MLKHFTRIYNHITPCIKPEHITTVTWLIFLSDSTYSVDVLFLFIYILGICFELFSYIPVLLYDIMLIVILARMLYTISGNRIQLCLLHGSIYTCSQYKMSRCMGKPTICIGENKAAVSFALTAKLISAFVLATRIVQFLYFLNPKFQAQTIFCDCTGWFVLDLVRTQIVGFLMHRLKCLICTL